MKKIIDYRLVYATVCGHLATQTLISELIDDGYQPHGSPVHTENSDIVIQAFVKYVGD